jgi:hypothetical protein
MTKGDTSDSMQTPHVHLRLKGRMGNQLFQYWVGKYVSMMTGLPLKVFSINESFVLNSSYFPNLINTRLLKHGVNIPKRYLLNDPNSHTHEDKLVFNNEFHEYDNDFSAENIISEYSKSNKKKNILISCWHERYDFISQHETWIRNLYARKVSCPLDIFAIHMRIGDLREDYKSSLKKYIQLAVSLAIQYQIEVVVVTEEPMHIDCQLMLSSLKAANVICRTTRHSNDSFVSAKKDFDVLCRARHILMTNSTFSWWAAFLNPYKPDVHVALHSSQPHAQLRNNLMFTKGPAYWKRVQL